MRTGRGGGLALTGASSMLLLSSTLESNRADMGGGIFLKDTSELRTGVESIAGDYYSVVEGETISSNPTVFSGNLAGLSVDEFEKGGSQNGEEGSSSGSDSGGNGDSSMYGRGGALHASQLSRVEMFETKVIGNRAIASGAGVYMGDVSHLIVDRSTFEGNSALSMGGAIHTSHMVCPEIAKETVQEIIGISELSSEGANLGAETTSTTGTTTATGSGGFQQLEIASFARSQSSTQDSFQSSYLPPGASGRVKADAPEEEGASSEELLGVDTKDRLELCVEIVHSAFIENRAVVGSSIYWEYMLDGSKASVDPGDSSEVTNDPEGNDGTAGAGTAQGKGQCRGRCWYRGKHAVRQCRAPR